MVQSIKRGLDKYKDLSLGPQVPPKLGVVAHTCNPAAQEEADDSLELTGNPVQLNG